MKLTAGTTGKRSRAILAAPVSLGLIGLTVVAGLAPSGWEARGVSAKVDLALLLAIDTSRSISAEEHRLQLDGYAKAFRHPAVLDAIADGGERRIVVAVLEWANTETPMVAVEWTYVDEAASAEALARTIETLPYRPRQGTSIGSAIAFGHALLDRAPAAPARRVIDVSGDYRSMRPELLAQERDSAIRDGITINGLPIRDEHHLDVAEYYARYVVGGPGSFMVVADGFASFEQAVLRKLILEIAGRSPRGVTRVAGL